MLKFNKHITKFLNEIIRVPFIIIDKNSNIIFKNISVEKLENNYYSEINDLIDIKLLKSFNSISDLIKEIIPEKIELDEAKLFDKIVLTKLSLNENRLISAAFIQDDEDEVLETVYPVSRDLENLHIDRTPKEIINYCVNNYQNLSKFEIAEKFNGLIWIKNKQNEYEYVNDFFSKEIGIPVDELIGLDERKVISVGKQNCYTLIDDFIFNSGNSVLIRKNKFKRSDLDQINWLVKYPILNGENKVISIISLEYLSEEIKTDYFQLGQTLKKTDISTGQLFNMENIQLTDSNIPSVLFNPENFQIIESNEKFNELYGYSSSQIISQSILDLFSTQDLQVLLNIENQNNDITRIGPVKNLKRDGGAISVIIESSSVEYKNKNAILFRIYPVKENEAIEKQQKNYTDYDLLGLPIIITDKFGFIIFVNKKAKTLLNYSEVELDNRPFASLFDDEDKMKVNDIVDSISDDRNNLSIVAKLKSSDNNTKLFEVNGNFDSDKNEIIFILQEKKVNYATHKSLKIDFLVDLFHELRTPINVILGFVHEIYESIENPSDEQKESAEIIFQNQKILLQIMDAAAQYAQLELGDSNLKFSKQIVPDVLSKIVDNLNYQLNKNNVELTTESFEGELQTDLSKLSSFLFHAFRFAIHVTETNKLFLRSYEKDNKIFIGIRDEEQIITPEFLAKLKLTFSTQKLTDSNNFGIPEIVIRLSRKLAELLNIKTEVVVSNDSPFEFAFVLPKVISNFFLQSNVQDSNIVDFKVQQKTTDIETEIKNDIDVQINSDKTEINASVSSEQNNNGKINLGQMSCLYFEDQLDSQLLFKTQFKDLNHLDIVSSLEEALPLLEKSKYDFIIMDINLEGKFNGMNALKIVRKFEGFKNIPVIAVTAYDLPTEHAKYLSLGFNDYLPKPFLRDDVLRSLKKIL